MKSISQRERERERRKKIQESGLVMEKKCKK